MRILTLIAAMMLATLLHAQEDYDGQMEMKEDMQLIVNELKLEKDQIFTLGNILEERRKSKEGIAQQISAVNQRGAMIPEDSKQDKAQIQTLLTDMTAKMAAADEKAFSQIEDILTPSQKSAFSKAVKPKLTADKMVVEPTSK